jgi:hypothetical protein
MFMHVYMCVCIRVRRYEIQNQVVEYRGRQKQNNVVNRIAIMQIIIISTSCLRVRVARACLD